MLDILRQVQLHLCLQPSTYVLTETSSDAAVSRISGSYCRDRTHQAAAVTIVKQLRKESTSMPKRYNGH